MNAQPGTAKAIIGIAIAQALIAWGFFAGFSLFAPESELVSGIATTASIYSVLAVPIVLGVLKQKGLVVRVCLALNILVSLPLKAIVGIVLSVIALIISFRPSAKSYFGAGHGAALGGAS